MLSRRQLLAGAIGLIAPGAAAAASAGSGTLVITELHVPGHPMVETLRWIGQELVRATDGRLGARVYHSGQLGRENDTVELARYGAIDITRVNLAALSNLFPLTGVLTLPYVFDGVAHMRRSLDGDVGRDLLRAFERRGLVGLAFYDSGERCFYNTQRPVHEPRDLVGMKVRVPMSDIFLQFVRAMGANPTPLAYGEIFTGLETHLIDGAENNWPSFEASRHFEAARHWAQTRHSLAPEALLISQRRYQRLAPADRELLLDIARRSVAVMRGYWDEREAAARARCIAQGVQVSQVDREAFRRAAEPVVRRVVADAAIGEMYRRIRAQA